MVGLAETHGRVGTEAMLDPFERVPRRHVTYRGATLEELDVDALQVRHPTVALVDELAHQCVPGSRHEKRWEDVEDLLNSGIDVVTSLNVQHLDSLSDAVETLAGVAQRETVPDAVVAAADRVDFVDITPERLRARIADTEVVGADTAPAALGGFFSADRSPPCVSWGWAGWTSTTFSSPRCEPRLGMRTQRLGHLSVWWSPLPAPRRLSTSCGAPRISLARPMES